MIEKQKSQKTHIVAQLNCRGLNRNKIEILNILEKTQADIACLNETNLRKKSHPKLEGFTLAGNTSHSRLGSAMYIKRRLNYELIETKTYKSESKLTQECVAIKLLGLYVTNIYVSPRLEIKTDLITKIANDEGHLLTGDINVNHLMFGAYDLTTNRTGKLIEQWLDEENYIILNNYDCTHKDGGTLDVHLANPKLTSLFDNFYVFNESPSDHYPTVSTYNIDKPIDSCKKVNWQKYKTHILHTSEDLDRNITNKVDLEKNIDKITQKISIGIQRGHICQQTQSHKPPNQKN